MPYMKDTDETRKIRREAALVANTLTTDHKPKKHGGYNYYKDDKLTICLDTCVANLDIYLSDGTQVFDASYGADMVSCFHRGRWQAYLSKVALRAAQEDSQRRGVRQAEERRQREASFCPIDDAALFPEEVPA